MPHGNFRPAICRNGMTPALCRSHSSCRRQMNGYLTALATLLNVPLRLVPTSFTAGLVNAPLHPAARGGVRASFAFGSPIRSHLEIELGGMGAARGGGSGVA